MKRALLRLLGGVRLTLYVVAWLERGSKLQVRVYTSEATAEAARAVNERTADVVTFHRVSVDLRDFL